jgi:hypothetical protein
MLSRLCCTTILLCTAAPLAAQSPRSADASATVSIPIALTLTNTAGLDFGSHFALEGVIAAPSAAAWFGTTDAGNNISFAFVLPSSLARVNGGGNGPVPITFGAASAIAFSSGGTDQTFNPAGGLASYRVPAGDFGLYLGSGAGAQGVTVNLSGRAAGTYQGTITLTVTVL